MKIFIFLFNYENDSLFRLNGYLFMLFLILIMFSSGSVNGENNILNFEQAIQIGLKYHPDIKIAEDEHTRVKMELRNLNLEDEETLSRQELYKKEEEVVKAKANIEKVKMQIAFNIENKYYNIIKNRHFLDIQNRNMEYLKRQLNIAEVKYENGMIAKDDLNDIKRKKSQIASEIEKGKFNLETAKMELNMAMGCKLDNKFEIEEFKLKYEPVDIDLEWSLNFALQHKSSVQSATKEVERIKELLEINKEINSAGFNIMKLKQDFNRAEIELEKLKKELVISIRNSYMGLKSSMERVENAQWSYEKAKKDLNAIEIKYKEGLISLLEMFDGSNKMAEAEMSWMQTIYDYNINRAGFFRTIGREYGYYRQFKGGENED